ncbi:methyltransferase domain-containing protein [uncultured Croceitalea sp.]|uniref:class I SAM-dependent methyltransferase n=1 Tax=uncultured Croceitalea sp. TaxID=1798908 RepID=UPI00330608B6
MVQNTNNYGLDVFGQALLDYQKGAYTEDIKTCSSLDEEDSIPLPHLFRTYKKMPLLEKKALELCKGSILDIGAGAGSHSLYLQGKGHRVCALDISLGAIETCKLRGVKKTTHSNILDYSGTEFDTLLLLMNGIGIVEKLKNLNGYLKHFKSILKPSGQILLDSSDIIYMYDEDEDGGYWIPESINYYGEVEFTMQYKNRKSKPFGWLYLDYNALRNACEANNLKCELVSEGKHYDYLARLTLKS